MNVSLKGRGQELAVAACLLRESEEYWFGLIQEVGTTICRG